MAQRGALYYYGRRFFEVPGASRQVLKLPLRLILFAALHALRKSAAYKVRFGPHRFRFRYLPLGRGEGSRGTFFLREAYEPLLEFGSIFLRPGDTAIDCGSNQGIYACAFSAAVGPKGRVLAIEPIPWQAERIRANLALNAFGHCEVVEAAVSDSDGSAELRFRSEDVSASITRIDSGSRSLPVRTVSLDSLIAAHNVGPVALVKLDVEGAEVLALRGAAQLLSRADPPVVCTEVNGGAGPAIMEALSPHGYRPFTLDAEGLHPLHELTIHSNVFFVPPSALARLAPERAAA